MKLQRFAGNFKPTFWSKYIQTELAKDLVIANWCDYKFEGEIKQGERVKIVGAVRPTIGTYVPGTDITIEKLADNAQYLDIEYFDYFAFEVDDVDKAQSMPGYLDAQFSEAKKALAEKEDAKIKEFNENLESYNDYKTESKNVIQVGGEIVDPELKKEFEKKQKVKQK